MGAVPRILFAAAALAAVAASPARATTGRALHAGFTARSYRPGRYASLRLDDTPSSSLIVQIFRVGGPGDGETDHTLAGTAVSIARRVSIRHLPATIRVGIGDWPSGLYAARLVAPDGQHDYAPFVVRPRRLGLHTRALVVLPTNTWQAYNFYGGDSWYETPAVHVIDLTRPFLGNGLPPHDGLEPGFFRWLDAGGYAADVVSDDDLERFRDAAQLRHLYDLIVFPGHEEYVTSHVFDLVQGFRDRGGNLAFLAANNFFYRVEREGQTIVGRQRWRDLGRPEAALVGAEYVAWDEARLPNRPYRVISNASWFYGGTGLHAGSTFGHYGIEIDARTPASPPGTQVLAAIPDDFGSGLDAEMTYYRLGRSQVFDAGVMNFGASADWPLVSTLMDNLWRRLHGGPPKPDQTPLRTG